MIELKFTGPAFAPQQYLFLGQLDDLIHAIEKISGLFVQRLNGESDNDTMLDLYERIAASYRFNELMHIGAGSAVFDAMSLHWFRYAVNMYADVNKSMLEDARYMSEVSLDIVQKRHSVLKTVLGAISFCLLHGLGILARIGDDSLNGEFDMSEGIKAFLDDRYQGKPLLFIENLYTRYITSPPFIPVRLEFPDEWAEFCAQIEDTEFGREILDYGDTLFLPDVKAIILESFPIDETLLTVLQEREYDLYRPSKLYPHKFAQFIANIPDKYSNLLLLYEDRLSEELIDESLVADYVLAEAFVQKLAKATPLKELYKDTTVVCGEQAIRRITGIFTGEAKQV